MVSYIHGYGLATKVCELPFFKVRIEFFAIDNPKSERIFKFGSLDQNIKIFYQTNNYTFLKIKKKLRYALFFSKTCF